jgi:hypothetical protein
MTISSIPSTSSSYYAIAPSYNPTQAESLADTAVNLSGDSGVIAMLAGPTASTGDSVYQLYTALASAPNLASTHNSAKATDGTDPTSDASSTDPASDASSVGLATTTSDTSPDEMMGVDSSSASSGDSTTDPASTVPTNLNGDWSSYLQANPDLASLVGQLSTQQSLVDTFA